MSEKDISTTPRSKKNAINKTVLVGQFAALITIGAFIRVPVPLVPFTLQFLFTTLAGLILGSKYGALSVALYIALGIIGLPIFTMGGGLAYIFQPTFGYLLGFCLGAFITGKIREKIKIPTFKKLLFANLMGLSAVYLCGISYYYFISKIYIGSEIAFWTVFVYCFLLAVPGDIILSIVASFYGVKLIKIYDRGVLRK